MRQMDRRTFVSGAVAGLAAASARGALGAGERLGVAVIGVNGMGHSHVRTLAARSDVRVVALCDVDQGVLARAAKTVKDATGQEPALVGDFRRLLDDPRLQAVVVATPHHWHCPIALRAIAAGKDVYLEKPASHVFREGRLLVEAAKKHGRIVEHGTQMRSSEVTARAGQLLSSGVIGKVKMAKALNLQRHRPRRPAPDAPPPAGVDYDLWLGPAPQRGFNPNRFHGYWNWYRDYGNGDLGGDGIHDLDLARWGLGVTTHPVSITAHGSTIDLVGEREFPDNMVVTFQYDEGKVLIYEDRGWTPYGQYGFDSSNVFYGTEGFMVFSRRGYFQVHLGPKEEKGPSMRGETGHPDHLVNFLDCVRSRKRPAAPAEVAHLSCALVHLGEIAYRVGRVLKFDRDTEKVLGDPEADGLLTKPYRAPWGLPEPPSVSGP